ncbi:MAG: choice-of-anchor tandem repeat GloVer-containing protein [Geminicoccaceae bacterium]
MSSIRRYTVLVIVALSLIGLGPRAQATTPLHRFTNDLSGNSDGAFPKAGLIIDANGALYGTTNEGGSNGYGTVFKLAPTPSGPTAWKYTTLYSFCQSPDCIDGAYPEGGVTADSQGNLYGTTSEGGGRVSLGSTNFGTVFKLTPSGSGYKESVLYSFSGLSDGAYPKAGLLWFNGELYGTTEEGGNSDFNGCLDVGCGVVFKLTPTNFGPWKLTVLYTFSNNQDGANPLTGVIADAAGNLYGTTSSSGGTVFMLTPPAIANNKWKYSLLHQFLADDDGGSSPRGGLFIGPRGHVYGTTYEGGTSDACGVTGCGTVFALWRPSSPTAPWNHDVLHSFTGGADGAYPLGALIKDKSGAIYGTASEGGNFDFGTVYKLTPPTSGNGPYTTTVLRTFGTVANGQYPYAGVIMGPKGSIYGTTYEGGYTGGSGACGFNDTGCGVVFQLSPTGAGK